jgi:biopolymer transport protein ExbD
MRIPTSRQRASQVDMQTAMTPLIDVVFQLLIFFICASTGHMKEFLLATDFRAGSVGSASPIEMEKPLGEAWIRIKRADDITTAFLEGQEFRDLNKLASALKGLAAASTKVPIILDIAGEVPLGDVIQVYDTCRAARFTSVNFAADARRIKAKPPSTD